MKAVLACLLLCLPGVALAQSDAEHQQFLFAYKLLQRGELEESAKEFEEYLGKFPNGEKLGDAQYYRALLHRRAGENGKAAELLEEAAKPTLVPPYAVDLLSGQVLSDLGKYDEALKALEKIDTGELDPKVAVSALYLKGLAYRGADNLQAAATALGDAAKLDTPMKARALLDLAKVRALMKDKEQAVAVLDKCLALDDPAVAPEAARFAGDLSYNAGEYAPAIAYYNTVVARYQSSGHFSPAVVGLLWAQFADGRYDQVLQTFEQTIKALPTEDRLPAYYLAGSARQERGEHAKAVQLLDHIAKGDSREPIREKVLYKLAVSRFELEDYAAMNTAATRLLELFPDTTLRVDVAFLQATAEAEAGQVERGAARLTRFIDRGPTSPYYRQALLRRAHLYETHSEIAAAAEDYEAYLESVDSPTPTSLQAGFRLMELLNALGRHARVIRQASAVLELRDAGLRTPEVEQEALYRLAVAQRFSGEDEQALATHRRLTREHPINPYRAESVLEQGLIHMKLGDADRGIPLLLDAAQREGLGKSSKVNALRIVAQHDADNGNDERAMELRAQMQEVGGPEVLTQNEELWVGRHLLRGNGTAEAAIGYLQGITDKKLVEQAMLLTGRAYRLTGDYDAAKEKLDEVRAVSERYGVEAWLEIALVLRDAGELDGAIAELTPLQDPDRGHAIASKALFEAGRIHRTLHDQAKRRSNAKPAKQHADDAREAFKKLWLLYPDREGEDLAKRAAVELAELQHAVGDAADEVRTLEELAEAHPESAYASYAKAILAIRSNQSERADTYLRQAKERAKGDKELTQRADTLLRRER